MKAEDASRAALLVSALKSIKAVRARCLDAGPENNWYLSVAVWSPFTANQLSAPDFKAHAILDCTTGAAVADVVEAVIRGELVKLGVELPAGDDQGG